MLILTRKVGEKLVIDDNVTVTVLGVKGNQIRIGIDAPREIQVHREEIYQRILKERAADRTQAPAFHYQLMLDSSSVHTSGS